LVPSEDLVGREPVIHQIIARLQGGRSIMLAGPRRMGKTSVASEALRRLAEAGVITAELDFFSLTTKREAANTLVRQLLDNSHGFGARLRQMATAVSRALHRVEPHISIAETELGISLAADDENVAFVHALELPQRLAEREHTHVVVLMDEFQEASSNLGQNVYHIMRAAFQRQHDFQQLFIGSQESLLRQLFSRPNAALLRHAVEVHIDYAPPDAWLPYIQGKFGSAEIEADRAIIRQVLDVTGGHPADTMEFCQQLHIAAIDSGAHELTWPIYELALDQAERALKSIFDQLWVSLGTTAYSRLVARRLASGIPAYSKLQGGEAKPQLIATALRALQDRSIIERAAPRRYRFREPMFEAYVRRLGEAD